MGVVAHPLSRILEEPSVLADVHWLTLPWSGGYACDPWVVRDGDIHYLFFEYLDGATRKGCLGVGHLVCEDGVWALRDPAIVISEPHHLSHPTVFRRGGHWYLLPEAADCGHTVIYEAVDFPFTWRLCGAVLPGIPGLDPVFCEREDGLWITCTIKEGEDTQGLHLFHADRIEGEWRPHPRNPVRTGPAGTRPAGPFLSWDDGIHRPGQDSRDTYGRGVLVHRVIEWDEKGYEESEIGQVFPAPVWPRARGLHTVFPADWFVVLDAKWFTGLKAVLGDLLIRWRRLRR